MSRVEMGGSAAQPKLGVQKSETCTTVEAARAAQRRRSDCGMTFFPTLREVNLNARREDTTGGGKGQERIEKPAAELEM